MRRQSPSTQITCGPYLVPVARDKPNSMKFPRGGIGPATARHGAGRTFFILGYGQLPFDGHFAARPDSQERLDAVSDKRQFQEPALALDGKKRHFWLAMFRGKDPAGNVAFAMN